MAEEKNKNKTKQTHEVVLLLPQYKPKILKGNVLSIGFLLNLPSWKQYLPLTHYNMPEWPQPSLLCPSFVSSREELNYNDLEPSFQKAQLHWQVQKCPGSPVPSVTLQGVTRSPGCLLTQSQVLLTLCNTLLIVSHFQDSSGASRRGPGGPKYCPSINRGELQTPLLRQVPWLLPATSSMTHLLTPEMLLALEPKCQTVLMGCF